MQARSAGSAPCSTTLRVERPSSWELLIAAAVLLAFAATVGGIIAAGTPLGYDEAVYAARAREFVTGVPSITWGIYRPPGLSVLGMLAGFAGWTDTALRAITLVIGVLAVCMVWLLARVAFGVWPALVALGVTAASPSVLSDASQFLNDQGAAGAVLGSMALLWVELEVRLAPTRRVWLVAPLWAAALYLRFGAVMFIASLVVVSLILWWRVLWRHRRLALAVPGFTVVLLIPHVIESLDVNGTPWGTFLVAKRESTIDVP